MIVVKYLSSTPFKVIKGIAYAIWSYDLHGSGLPGSSGFLTDAHDGGGVFGLAFSGNLQVLDPAGFPELSQIQGTKILRAASSGVLYVYKPAAPNALGHEFTLAFLAPAKPDQRCPIQCVSSRDDGRSWTTNLFRTDPGGEGATNQIITGPAFVCPPSKDPPPAKAPTTGLARFLEKATYVPLLTPDLRGVRKAALAKFGFARNLSLQAGEVDAARDMMNADAAAATPGPVWFDTLKRFEGRVPPAELPRPSAFAEIPIDSLAAFGQALVQLRRTAVDRAGSETRAVALNQLNAAAVASQGLEFNVNGQSFGMLNLERLAMAPAGLVRGELLATIPLAPREKTAVVQKEWSVTSQEFTSIVTDSLEDYSETGVTDNTELAQSSTSQIARDNQFNVNATVSGNIGLVTGSAASAFTAQDKNSQSATDSRKHASTVTHKASSRSKQEHKVTISTSTVTGSSETTTRQLVNPSDTDPMRIDYFSIMRKWQVGLYRYGLRMTYDIAIPEPASALREDYCQLALLQQQLALGFNFPVRLADITDAILPGETIPHYQVLAGIYGANVPPPPAPFTVLAPFGGEPKNHAPNDGDAAWRFDQFTFSVPPDTQVSDVFMAVKIGNVGQPDRWFEIIGYPVAWLGILNGQNSDEIAQDLPGYLVGVTGNDVPINFLTIYCSSISIVFNVTVTRTQASYEQWQSNVWTALYNAAQGSFYTSQQTVSNQIQALQDKINNVDTLTLRREEGDEIMKNVIRWLIGTKFDFMPPEVEALFVASGASAQQLQYGTGFTGNELGLNTAQWTTMMRYQEMVKFINVAIDWENVLYYLFSYYWDVPQSWDFVRQIQHPDATRQAFLRSGSARVVLTVRKGFEPAWAAFMELGDLDQLLPPGHPYVTIAQEIQDYDNTNYPGIPPANSGQDPASSDEEAEAVCVVDLAAGPGPVSIPVDNSAGFGVGMSVVIDTYDSGVQETQKITAIPDATHLVVAALTNPHNGSAAGVPIVQPGEYGVLMAEWYEYTPSSGTDIAVTSNLATIV